MLYIIVVLAVCFAGGLWNQSQCSIAVCQALSTFVFVCILDKIYQMGEIHWCCLAGLVEEIRGCG